MGEPRDGSWNPYVAGALTGLLIVISAYSTGNYFGASTSFVRTAGMIERVFSPEYVAQARYFARFVPHIDWQWLFLAGVLLGALCSALLSRDFAWRGVPGMWASRFGPGGARRATVSFAGGFIMLVGARIAGG